ncbi:MAG: MaoC family dehydratase [Halioglobus sp.]|nr:MaoC family dehydratase [Halioglobus sp.]
MNNVDFSSVQVGDLLPELSIDITSKLITGAAIASRDYQNVHHDQDAARALGSPNIFMNILTTNGFVGRYITDWTGPSGIVKKVSIRLGAPNYPGDAMVMIGEVIGKDDSDQSIELKVTGTNAIGDHVVGNVTVRLS